MTASARATYGEDTDLVGAGAVEARVVDGPDGGVAVEVTLTSDRDDSAETWTIDGAAGRSIVERAATSRATVADVVAATIRPAVDAALSDLDDGDGVEAADVVADVRGDGR